MDARVGRHLFSHCLQDYLKNKTRILVTHQLHYLRQVDYILYMEDGQIADRGTFAELMARESAFARMMDEHGDGSGDDANHHGSDAPSIIAPVDKRDGPSGGADARPTHALMTKEERVVGAVQRSTIKAYVDASGGWLVVVVLAVLEVLWQCTRVAADLWLSYWTSRTFHQSQAWYMGIYGLLGASCLVVALITRIAFPVAVLRATQRLFSAALHRVVRAPISFFDTTPLGRITNRYSHHAPPTELLSFLVA